MLDGSWALAPCVSCAMGPQRRQRSLRRVQMYAGGGSASCSRPSVRPTVSHNSIPPRRWLHWEEDGAVRRLIDPFDGFSGAACASALSPACG